MDTMPLKICCLQTSVYYTNAGFINVKSLALNTCYQGYFAENFVSINLMRDQKDCADIVRNFAHIVGAPAEIISDNDPMFIKKNSDLTKECCFLKAKQSSCEPGMKQQQNNF